MWFGDCSWSLFEYNTLTTTTLVFLQGLHLLFNKFERQYLHLLKFALLFSPLAPLYIILPHYRGIALNVVLTAYGTTYATLLMSLIIYRLSPIHPLWKYPGPVLAKCTKFWGVYHSSTGCIHHTLSDLHRYYGSVVRTGKYLLCLTGSFSGNMDIN